MHPTVFNLGLTAFALAVAVGAHASTIIGDSVHTQYLYPDTSTVYSDLGTDLVTASSPHYADVNNAGVLNIDITASQLVFSWYGSGYSFAGTFDGVEFTDLTHPFTSAVLDQVSNTPGILPGAVTLTGGSIFVDLNGATYSPGQNVTVDVSGLSGVPEPAIWGLMLLGVGAVGAMARRGRVTGVQAA
jgi:hypothetical protein